MGERVAPSESEREMEVAAPIQKLRGKTDLREKAPSAICRSQASTLSRSPSGSTPRRASHEKYQSPFLTAAPRNGRTAAGGLPLEMKVSYGSPLDAKEQVKQAIDIVDLVGSFIPLRRQGRNFVGLCPWHDDSRPSLQVNQERQSFKCWVCDIGGDIFSFMMKMEGVEFREAL